MNSKDTWPSKSLASSDPRSGAMARFCVVGCRENKTPNELPCKTKICPSFRTKCEKNNWGIHKENLGDVLCWGGWWTKSCWKLINGSFYKQVQYQMIQLVQDPLSSSTLPPAVSSCKATQHGKRGANFALPSKSKAQTIMLLQPGLPQTRLLFHIVSLFLKAQPRTNSFANLGKLQ